MKVFRIIFEFLLLAAFVGCSYHDKVIEYYEDGKTKRVLIYNKGGVLDGLSKYYDPDGGLSEDRAYVDGVLKQHRKYFPNGNLYFELGMEGEIKSGLSREYFENGNLRIEADYLSGRLVRYNEFDLEGSIVHWFKEIEVDSLPVFRDEFVDITNITDTGFYVQITVPDVSPYQLIPSIPGGRWQVIDSSKSLWHVETGFPPDPIMKVVVRVAINEEDIIVLGRREVRLSDFIK